MTVCGAANITATTRVDVVNANILAMRSNNVGKGETINIGCGRPTSVNELVEIMGGEFVFVDPRPGDRVSGSR